ncbi:MAG: hypothetical protein ACRDUV_08695 [Pseudonocardiaceae bacterium]
MPTTLPTQRDIDPAATTPIPRMDATPHLSAQTLNWLTQRPHAQALVDSVWDTLTELEATTHHRGVLAALRFVLVHHQPTPSGRCRACRRVSWRGLWRRRRFPCLVWRQVRGELLGHLATSGLHRRRPDNSRSVR